MMTILLKDTSATPSTTSVPLRERLRVRLKASQLNDQLASGAPPESSVALARYAQRIVEPARRRALAQNIEHILLVADKAAASRLLKAPLCQDRIRGAAVELQAAIDRLCSPTSIHPRGAAMIQALIADGCGPLYRRHNKDDLRSMLRDALTALTPAADHIIPKAA
jgi:hypothetical protein